ncbi:hypothetical protein SORBI_3001G457433 [Sorghum bicolor]|uniref:4a-hydroxytetrahydrobiopterin dehydratase n=1 Tax=Sorghum bicolor TaxID=4558 RepID=A0A1Z5SAQ7_SORBI|nr:hypothetical protein SORBI_3001G457433 [Sorghum bicolor]
MMATKLKMRSRAIYRYCELSSNSIILKLHRALKVKNFVKALEFFQLVAAIAEEEGGLTSNDFIIAVKINDLTLEGIIRKKAT